MSVSRTALAMFVGVILGAGGCDDPNEPPAPGAIRVVVAASGEDISTNELQLSVENGTSRQLALGGMTELTIPALEPGPHILRLHGTAVNCEVTGQNPRSGSPQDRDS